MPFRLPSITGIVLPAFHSKQTHTEFRIPTQRTLGMYVFNTCIGTGELKSYTTTYIHSPNEQDLRLHTYTCVCVCM